MAAAFAALPAAPLAAEPKIALLGALPAGRSLEGEAAEHAVDDADALAGAPRLKLEAFDTGAQSGGVDAAVDRAVRDPDVLAVVVYGEAGVGPGPLAAFAKAGLAVVAATSWAQPRPASATATWLSPTGPVLAATAALYARREARLRQIAVVDDGSDTGAAAARSFAARYRALGGQVPYLGTWTGDAVGLSATVRAMAPYWPQMVFYTGSGGDAARLLLAMRDQHSLKNADLFGMPPIFDPAFFEATRLKAIRTRAVFPCPDYDGMGNLVRNLGFGLPRTSPQYRAYVHYDWRHPGSWSSMLYDAVALAARAVREARKAASAPGPSAGLASAASGTASAASPTADTTPDQAQAPAPTRPEVLRALAALPGYRGMRGDVKFSARREPSDARAMIYFALNRVDRKTMLWQQRAYGPPF